MQARWNSPFDFTLFISLSPADYNAYNEDGKINSNLDVSLIVLFLIGSAELNFLIFLTGDTKFGRIISGCFCVS